MRKFIGWIILIVGFFLFGVLLNSFLNKKTEPVSPIPSDDQIKVILLSPQPTK